MEPIHTISTLGALQFTAHEKSKYVAVNPVTLAKNLKKKAADKERNMNKWAHSKPPKCLPPKNIVENKKIYAASGTIGTASKIVYQYKQYLFITVKRNQSPFIMISSSSSVHRLSYISSSILTGVWEF